MFKLSHRIKLTLIFAIPWMASISSAEESQPPRGPKKTVARFNDALFQATAEKTPSLGRFRDAVYYNNFFTPFAVLVPDGWKVRSDLLTKKVQLLGGEIQSGESPARFKPEDVKFLHALVAETVVVDVEEERRQRFDRLITGKPLIPDTPVRHYMISAEVWGGFPGPVSHLLDQLVSRDLEDARRQGAHTATSYAVNSNSARIDGHPCLIREMLVQSTLAKQFHRLYALRRASYVLVFRVTFPEPDDTATADFLVERLIRLGETKPPEFEVSEQASLNFVTALGATHLKDRDGRVISLDLHTGQILPDELARLRGLKHLRTLVFHRMDVTDDSLRWLAEFHELQSLGLDGTTITDRGLAHVGKLANLTWLNLSDTRITDKGVAHLAALRGLEELRLARCLSVTDRGLASLRGLNKLRYLDLTQTSVTDEGITHLKHLQGLTWYSLARTKVTHDAELELMRALPRLANRIPGDDPHLIAKLRGHSDIVQGVAFSPDGKLLASSSNDGTIKIWDVAQRQVTREINGGSAEILCVAFSPDGQQLASGSSVGTITIWNVASGQQIQTLDRHRSYVWAVEFSPDGRSLASGGRDAHVYVWDLGKGKPVRTERHSGSVYDVSFAPDGASLVTCSQDEVVVVWSLEAKKPRWYRNLRRPVRKVTWSPDGETIVAAHSKVAVLDAKSGAMLEEFKGKSNFVVGALAVSSDANVLAAARYRTLQLLDARSAQQTANLTGHTKSVRNLAFSPDGKTLASAGEDNMVMLWHYTSANQPLTEFMTHDSKTRALAVSDDGRVLASAGEFNPIIKIWDSSTGRKLRSLKLQRGKKVFDLAFLPGGHTLVAAATAEVQVWDAMTATRLHAFVPVERAEGESLLERLSHSQKVISIGVSPDGRRLATGHTDKSARLWNTSDWTQVCVFQGHTNSVNCVRFSPDGKTLATTAGGAATVKVWDVERGKSLATITTDTDFSYSVAFSPDGSQLATNGNQRIVVYSVASGERMHVIPTNTHSVCALEYLANDRILASGSAGLELWDIKSRKMLKSVGHHGGYVDRIIIFPNGQQVATVGSDEHVRTSVLESETASLVLPARAAPGP